MRGAMSKVQKERLVLPSSVVDELDGPVGEQERRVPLAAADLGGIGTYLAPVQIHVFGPFRAALLRKVQLAEPGRGGALEAPFPRRRAMLLAQMPLAHNRGMVPRIAQHLGHRHTPLVQPPVSSPRFGSAEPVQVAHARLVRVESGQQRSSGGAATGRVVELGEPQALGSQRVEVRCGDLAAITADVRSWPVLTIHLPYFD
jgi:hypothetical protein